MNCFVHPDAAAVGFCKHCLKALCRPCCIETTEGLACSESCADRLRLLEKRAAEADVSIARADRVFGNTIALSAISRSNIGWRIIGMVLVGVLCSYVAVQVPHETIRVVALAVAVLLFISAGYHLWVWLFGSDDPKA